MAPWKMCGSGSVAAAENLGEWAEANRDLTMNTHDLKRSTRRGLGVWLAVMVLAGSSAMRAEAEEDARERYVALCASCHGLEMRGGTGTALVQSSVVAGGDEAALARIIREGAGGGAMPAFGGALSDEEIGGLVALIRAQFEDEATRPARAVGAVIEAEWLNPATSSGYHIVDTEAESRRRYIGYFGGMSVLTYDDVDLTGVRSIELDYARGMDDAGRFAVLAVDRSGLGERINLGEAKTSSTGGWEEFRTRRIGLARELKGKHTLAIYGVEGGGIFNLDRFRLSDEPGENDGASATFGGAAGTYSAGGYRFRLERVAEAPGELWAMAFLPDGSMIASQKNGQLVRFVEGQPLEQIVGTPPVWDRVQGGLFGVLPHPDYARNGWLYLAFADVGPGEGMESGTMTRIVRGRIEGRRWVDQQDIYRAAPEFYTTAYAHFGGRMVLLDGHLYFSAGDRTTMQWAQDLSRPFGKIHRVREDGRVPEDNPFVGREGALPTIWSLGHRNPQGMTLNAKTRTVWSAEHGPRGGDELNLVRGGENYGWPLATFGINYDGTPLAESPFRSGMQPPVHHWTPSIAVSQIAFYDGEAFPDWAGNLLVASLGAQELRLMRMEGERAIGEEVLFKGHGRIRDVVSGPDGFPYVVINRPNGVIYRMAMDDGTADHGQRTTDYGPRDHGTTDNGLRGGWTAGGGGALASWWPIGGRRGKIQDPSSKIQRRTKDQSASGVGHARRRAATSLAGDVGVNCLSDVRARGPSPCLTGRGRGRWLRP